MEAGCMKVTIMEKLNAMQTEYVVVIVDAVVIFAGLEKLMLRKKNG
jgi:hypothetical protein